MHVHQKVHSEGHGKVTAPYLIHIDLQHEVAIVANRSEGFVRIGLSEPEGCGSGEHLGQRVLPFAQRGLVRGSHPNLTVDD